MSIFEFAMKMEQDGRSFYLDHAAKSAAPELKRILLELADDEQKHYNLFKALRDGSSAEYKESERTTILASVKNVFENMKSANKSFQFSPDARMIWEEAREIEKKSEQFYRAKAVEVTATNERTILMRVADEEHRHWVTIEQVIQFLDRPKRWLDDAEWSNLEDY